MKFAPVIAVRNTNTAVGLLANDAWVNPAKFAYFLNL
jgi:hypothetical protein